MTTPEELEEAKVIVQARLEWSRARENGGAYHASVARGGTWEEWTERFVDRAEIPVKGSDLRAVLKVLSAVSGDGWRPEGWVLVPKVPTTEQRRKNAARVASMLRAVTGKDFAGWDFADDLYDQFVRAAPLPPVRDGT